MGVQQTINFPSFEWYLNRMKYLLNTEARMLPPLYETADVYYNYYKSKLLETKHSELYVHLINM